MDTITQTLDLDRMDREHVEFATPGWAAGPEWASGPSVGLRVGMNRYAWEEAGKPLRITVQIMQPQQETTT